jgi:ElaB/YqjD/DUF883 family membrane-anchored ribosome-binding protein
MSTRKTTSQAKAQKSESVSESWDELAEHLDRLRNDITAINTSVSNLAKAGVSEGRERVVEQLDELAQRTNELGEEITARGRRAARQAGDQASAVTRDLEDAINRNPLTAMLVALGLGFIIGMTSRGRG